jgi:glycosyltransferase involved in cell wall biosynthesis
MPIVSVIIPCYNEQTTIWLLLEALYQQTYPRQDMEVIVAEGRSTDGTRQAIAVFQQAHPDLVVRVIDNPQRSIPAALNRAIAAARGQYIVRLDAHSRPYPDYVAGCLRALAQGLGENVGGVWEIHPTGSGWLARAIAAAAAHPLAVGDARYRFTAQAQAVDTVPFGAFRRDLVERIGGYDETLPTNEDYEFNVRVRQAGGTIWLDPAIRSTYFSRGTLSALARQYWRYGYWKARMLRRYPHTLRWRQALPPLFVLSLAGLAGLAPWVPAARIFLATELAVYSLALSFAGLHLAFRKRDFPMIIGIPLAIATMHFCWATALLWSFIHAIFTHQ